MKFIPLASSSRGNAYLLQDEGVQPLLLEAGIPIKQLRAKLREHGVSLSDLAGACVSHSHADHCKSVKDLLKAGVDAFMSTGTAKDLDVYSHHRCHSFGKAPVSGNISHWKVTTFPLEHDSSEPIGFLVDHGDERLGFIPDTQLVVNRFESPTIIAIETNYQEEILHENISKGYIPSVVGLIYPLRR
jgi:phosphoribosyl 1,2-cyclic phosphodiesterase